MIQLFYSTKSMKRLFLSLLATVSFATPVAAASFEDHVKLSEAVGSTGTTFLINPDRCDKSGSFGWYWVKDGQYREVVICQENKVEGSNAQVDWTSEDLDTLRHEAHHLVQDCRDGSFNGILDSVYQSPIKLAFRVMSPQRVAKIVEVYNDSTNHMVIMEIEAFSVAAMNDPLEQVRDIQKYCF